MPSRRKLYKRFKTPVRGGKSFAARRLPTNCSLLVLNDASSTHTTPNAHGHHPKLGARAFHFREQGRDLPRTRATQWMAESHRTTFWVQLLSGDLEVVDTHGCLRRESLVDFINVDVINFQTCFFQSSRNGKGGPDTHEVGINANHGKAAHACENRQSHFLSLRTPSQ